MRPTTHVVVLWNIDCLWCGAELVPTWDVCVYTHTQLVDELCAWRHTGVDYTLCVSVGPAAFRTWVIARNPNIVSVRPLARLRKFAPKPECVRAGLRVHVLSTIRQVSTFKRIVAVSVGCRRRRYVFILSKSMNNKLTKYRMLLGTQTVSNKHWLYINRNDTNNSDSKQIVLKLSCTSPNFRLI